MYFLLATANSSVWGVVYASAKRQTESSHTFCDFGFCLCIKKPQRFQFWNSENMQMMAVEVVHDNHIDSTLETLWSGATKI